MKKFLAAVGTAVVILTGATACNTGQGYADSGYEQVWDNGQYVYVPYGYYQSHRSMYRSRLHPAHHYSSGYVTRHHVTVEHRTTTTVHRNGSRTTTHTRTTHRTITSTHRQRTQRRTH